MSGHDIIVVGASAGGVETLTQIVRDLPPDLSAAIFIVLHLPSQSKSVLPAILNRSIQKGKGIHLSRRFTRRTVRQFSTDEST